MSVQASNLSRYFRHSFPAGLTVNVLPGSEGCLAEAARMAGMAVQPLDAAKWPFPNLISHFASGGSALRPTLIGQAEIDFHNQVRDDLARGMNVNGAAITEVVLTALGTRLRGDADIVARSPGAAEDTPQVVVEVKTGQFADLRLNQQYIYALALVGKHLQSRDSRLPKVGLTPGVPLPAMDFLLVTADAPGSPYRPALVRASIVDVTSSVAQIMLLLKALEAEG